jgi:hypothetical protein
MATLPITYSFSNGSPANANEVNKNFLDVKGFCEAQVVQIDGSVKAPTAAIADGAITAAKLAPGVAISGPTGPAGPAGPTGPQGPTGTFNSAAHAAMGDGLEITAVNREILSLSRSYTQSNGYDNINIRGADGNTRWAVGYDGRTYALGYSPVSDENMKNTIQDADSLSLCKAIDSIKPKTFYFNGLEEHRLGFIAQDIQEHLPIAVSEHDGVLSFDLVSVVAALVAKVQQLENRLAELEK